MRASFVEVHGWCEMGLEKAVRGASLQRASAELHRGRGAVSKQGTSQGVMFFLLLLISSVLA